MHIDWNHDTCNCDLCQEARLRLKMAKEVVVSLQAIVDFLIGYKHINPVIAVALVDRYWEGLQTGAGISAMMNLADRVVAGEVDYDREQGRFYTTTRLYI